MAPDTWGPIASLVRLRTAARRILVALRLATPKQIDTSSFDAGMPPKVLEFWQWRDTEERHRATEVAMESRVGSVGCTLWLVIQLAVTLLAVVVLDALDGIAFLIGLVVFVNAWISAGRGVEAVVGRLARRWRTALPQPQPLPRWLPDYTLMDARKGGARRKRGRAARQDRVGVIPAPQPVGGHIADDRVNAVVALVVVALVWGGRTRDLFRLDARDTASDYRKASVEDSLQFLHRMCNDGACLSERDWACGFANGDSEQLHECFDRIAQQATPSTKLGKIREFCGNRTMAFRGEVYSTPARCKEAGGKWAERSSPPQIEYETTARGRAR